MFGLCRSNSSVAPNTDLSIHTNGSRPTRGAERSNHSWESSFSYINRLRADTSHRPIQRFRLGQCLHTLREKRNTTLTNRLINATINNKPRRVKKILRAPLLDVNSSAEFGSIALTEAARRGHHRVVKALLRSPNINVNHTNDFDETPLLVAARHGHDKVISTLLTAPNIDVNYADETGNTALSEARWAGCLQSSITALQNASQATNRPNRQ